VIGFTLFTLARRGSDKKTEPALGLNEEAGLFSSLAWCAQAESERRDVA
jgi:hypothetical protein